MSDTVHSMKRFTVASIELEISYVCVPAYCCLQRAPRGPQAPPQDRAAHVRVRGQNRALAVKVERTSMGRWQGCSSTTFERQRSTRACARKGVSEPGRACAGVNEPGRACAGVSEPGRARAG
eukprot:200735-Pleurochrysis_carterae.AAC.3